MKPPKQIATLRNQPLAPALGAAFLIVLFALQSHGFPISVITLKDDAPFAGASNTNSLTSNDGLVTVAGWSNFDVTVLANIYQWWWIVGVDSGVGNGALLDGQESLTF